MLEPTVEASAVPVAEGQVAMSPTTPPIDPHRPVEQPAAAGSTEPSPTGPGRRRPVWLVVALAVAVAVIAALVAVLVWPDDDEETSTAPSTTEEPPTTATTEPSTQVTEPPTTAGPSPTTAVDTSTAVFPDGASGTRYDDPGDAARAFAVDFVGFSDPIVGEFMQGDSRSGEVEVRPDTNGPTTTVFVRQLGTDGSWWVLGSATANVTADAPGAGDAITSPLTVSGSALAFEGTVNVEVRQDGSREPLGTGFVTGGGDVARPFSGQIEFSTPTAARGAVVFLTRSAEDGAVWEAAVVRVRFP